jgi:hypothetical protein
MSIAIRRTICSTSRISTSRPCAAGRGARTARAQMEKSPNLSGMLHLLDAQIAAADEPRRKELVMRALIRQRTKNLPRYTCQNCGFRARLFYRQCPVAAAGKPMRRGASNLRCRADPGERRRMAVAAGFGRAAKLVNYRDVPEHL